MNAQRDQSAASPDDGQGGSVTRGGAGIHYLVGGVTLSLVLLVFYAFVFEAEPPPYLEEDDLLLAEEAQVSGNQPRVVIEEVDFGEETGVAPEAIAEAEAITGMSVADAEEPEPAGSPEAVAVAEPSDAAEAPAGSDAAAPEATVAQAGTTPEEDVPAGTVPPPEGDFVIQVIATRSEQNARRIADSIRLTGMRAYTEVLEREGENLHRVRVGPFPTRSEAEIGRRDLQKLDYEDAVIIDLR